MMTDPRFTIMSDGTVLSHITKIELIPTNTFSIKVVATKVSFLKIDPVEYHEDGSIKIQDIQYTDHTYLLEGLHDNTIFLSAELPSSS